jgi:macrolide transport system ATP-binding/permease protein
VLLVVAVGLLDGFRKMVVLDPGIRVHGLLMMEFEPSMIGYSSEQTELFSRQMIERVRGVTGVQSATLTRCIPFRPNFTERRVIPEGYDFPKGESRVIVSTNPVDEAYFETIGLPVLYGRAFMVSDSSSSRRVAVVNEEFARRFWASDNVVGRRMRLDDEAETVEVVGVARNAKYLSPTESQAPYIYLPLTQHPQNRFVMLVRTHGTPAEFTQPVLNVVRELDANQPVFNVRVFSDYYEQGVLGIALVALQMVGAIGISGLALALVGLYGLMAYLVARRTREIGVRMAVGASRMRVLRMILTHGLRFSGWGVAVGLALSIPVYRMLSAGLAGVGGASASTMVYVPLLLVLVTLAACAVPAWRATRIDPVTALREDG